MNDEERKCILKVTEALSKDIGKAIVRIDHSAIVKDRKSVV